MVSTFIFNGPGAVGRCPGARNDQAVTLDDVAVVCLDVLMKALAGGGVVIVYQYMPDALNGAPSARILATAIALLRRALAAVAPAR